MLVVKRLSKRFSSYKSKYSMYLNKQKMTQVLASRVADECRKHLELESASSTGSHSYSLGEVVCSSSAIGDTTDAEDTTQIDTTQLLSVSDNTLIHISEYLLPIERVSILPKVNWRFNDIFALNHYFNAAQPLNEALFECDSAYFEKNISPLLSADKKSITLYRRQMARKAHKNVWKLRQHIKYYLIHYRSLLRLQCRYNRNHEWNAFPTILKNVTVKIMLISDRSIDLLATIMRYSDAMSPIKEWCLRDCDLSDKHITVLCDSLMQRNKHFLPITKFDISLNPNITDVAMDQWFTAMGERCPKLKELNLSQTAISDISPPIIAAYFAQYIDLRSNHLPNIIWKDTKVTETGEKLFTSLIADALEPPF